MLTFVVKCLSEAIYCCDVADEISFTTVMAEKGIKVVPTICALLGATDPLFICLSHKLIIQEMMYLTGICLEVGSA